jgi:hypothetical protein
MTGAMKAREFVAALGSAVGREALLELNPPLVFVELDQLEDEHLVVPLEQLAGFPIAIVGIGSAAAAETPVATGLDTIVESDAAGAIERTVGNAPVAAVALVMLLRGASVRSVNDGLAVESAVYSALQAGSEFAAWRSGRPAREHGADRDEVTVRIARVGDEVRIVLHRPEVHNALNTRMRDELYEAFLVAASDPATHVVLSGDGPSFSAGGDLDEFGTRADPATAHVVRLRRSVGRLIASMSDRVTAVVHGACIGSGVELPAFAGHVAARPGARFGLPEIGFGLIPGAGGTVSLTRRIGRHRTAWLALSGEQIDASTALQWGLVDEILSD